MALLSILLGAICFLISIVWYGVAVITFQEDSLGAGFGLILGVFPALLGMLLIVPSSLYRGIYIFTKKPMQTVTDKIILTVGLFISLIYCGALIKLIYQ